jgi:hypothetical protein
VFIFCGWYKSEERRPESDMWKMIRTKTNMKFELPTGKQLIYNVAVRNFVLVIWFVLKDFNIITRTSGEKLIGRIRKEKGSDVTRPLQGGAGKIHNISKRVKPLIFKAGHLPNESPEHYRYNDAFDSLPCQYIWGICSLNSYERGLTYMGKMEVRRR